MQPKLAKQTRIDADKTPFSTHVLTIRTKPIAVITPFKPPSEHKREQQRPLPTKPDQISLMRFYKKLTAMTTKK